MGHEDAFLRPRLNARCRSSQRTFAGPRGNGRNAPLYRGLREKCRNGGGMDPGVVAYSREPRRVELREQLRRPLAEIAKNKVVGEIVDEDPDRWSQSSAGREYKMKGNFLRAPTGEYPNQASFSDRSHGNFSR